MTSKEKNNKDDDKLTDIPEEVKKKNGAEINVNQKTIPLINYKLNPILSSSILNYLFIGISLAMYGCVKRKFFNLDETKAAFYSKYYLASGIILYVSGIFDWYDGKELLFLVDFILSFFFICLYLLEGSNDEVKYFQIIESAPPNEKLRGTFCIFLFLLFFCIGISYIKKAKFYIANYAALFIGYIFLFLYKYFQKDWIEDAYSYIFIITGGLFWITALLKMIDNFMTDRSIICLSPSD